MTAGTRIIPREIHLFNTLTRKKEPLKPKTDGYISLYTCGPTVYNHAHIGNFRTYVFEDLLKRTLTLFGYRVEQVMNLTDVDDKTIKGAIAKDISLEEFTQPYKDAFFKDIKALNIEPANHYPAATDYIPQMIEMIQVLLDKGYAYQGKDGSIYYSIKAFKNYGCLSHLHLEDLKAGASERVASDEYEKDHVADFVLWKHYDPERDGKICWESPFGKGRPGWHLECSAMAMNILGESIDIHCGGIDNMFPHHENEIAQSEACSGKLFVQMWLHAEHLVVEGKKMSKSLGNFYRLQDLVDKGYTGQQIRYMLLHTHYKTQLNFTFQGLDSIKNTLHRINEFIQRVVEITQEASSGKVQPILDRALEDFSGALADDLNISVALAALFELIKEVNILCDQHQVSKEEAKAVLAVLRSMNSVLGVMTFEASQEAIPEELLKALERRAQARVERNWKLADELRDFIAGQGYVIVDTSEGSRLKKGDLN